MPDHQWPKNHTDSKAIAKVTYLKLESKGQTRDECYTTKKLKPWPCKSCYILLPSMPSYCSQRIFPIDLQSRKPRHANPQKNCTKVLLRFISTTSGPSSKAERYRFGAAKSSSNQITLFADKRTPTELIASKIQRGVQKDLTAFHKDTNVKIQMKVMWTNPAKLGNRTKIEQFISNCDIQSWWVFN